MLQILSSPPADERLFEKLLDLECAVYGADIVGERALCLARYRKEPSLFFLALDGGKLVGELCAYPISESLHRRIFVDRCYADSDILPEDVCELRPGAPQYIHMLDAVVDPAYRRHGLIHALAQAFRNFLREKHMQGHAFADLSGFCITEAGASFLHSLGFSQVHRTPHENILLMRKDPMAFLSEPVELPLPVEEASLAEAEAFLCAMLDSALCPPKAAMQTQVILDELLSNIIHYSGASRISLSCRVWDGEIRLRFCDDGKPYDPLQAPEPDISLSAEERGIGGLGILMVKKSADALHYAYEDGQNVLTVCKKYA